MHYRTNSCEKKDEANLQFPAINCGVLNDNLHQCMHNIKPINRKQQVHVAASPCLYLGLIIRVQLLPRTLFFYVTSAYVANRVFPGVFFLSISRRKRTVLVGDKCMESSKAESSTPVNVTDWQSYLGFLGHFPF